MHYFYLFLLALTVNYMVFAIVVFLWVYISTRDLNLTLSLGIDKNVREDKRLMPGQILLQDINDRIRYLIVIGLLFCMVIDFFSMIIKR
jgi:hypothetical protein